jgi:hypothetical protein
MQVEVSFQGERLELDVPEGRLVAAWRGPAGVDTARVPGLLARALEEPRGFPPLRQAVVPGDRVVIALGAGVPEPSAVLEAVCQTLASGGVDRADMTVLTDPEPGSGEGLVVPDGVTLRRHAPDDRGEIAYLASTAEGRRVYLNRLLTDADFVLPVGRLGYEPVLGYGGPWGVIFPGLSDAETRQAFRALESVEPPDRRHPRPALKESAEVSWLLGSQFQLGLVAGVTGMTEVVAGLNTTVFDEGSRAVDRAWGFRADSRAELVVVGIGRPGERSGIADLARGLTTATRLVQRGGKVVALSRAGGPLGPAVTRLLDLDDPRAGLSALKGQESAPDFAPARQLAAAVAWADVYLFSALDPDAVEGLSIIALDRPDEARRLAATSGSVVVVSQADQARARVSGETG